MIQRVQTIYLLAVVFLQTVMLFSVQATAFDELGTETLFQLSENWQWAFFIALSVLLPLTAIFLFKKRRLQIRLSIINALLLLALQIINVFFLIDITSKYKIVNYAVNDIFPAISLILTVLAIRFILRDEMKIRAYNRIR
jgi:hypothetical protein